MDVMGIWVAVAIVLGAVVAAVVARPQYRGSHRAPGKPLRGDEPGRWKEWLRGNPTVTPAYRREQESVDG